MLVWPRGGANSAIPKSLLYIFWTLHFTDDVTCGIKAIRQEKSWYITDIGRFSAAYVAAKNVAIFVIYHNSSCLIA